ncbi:conserved hypothetical protein [Methanocella paludicola SANAE]|uniref:DUF4097 domain-containing protein n=1 Tax=Methanocella paludicola (strain DSM 17711 / JCM 13418 / NBRC 101707 / SANAE) TaxID=304371 RepID=D1YX06_METPS|nr:DUF4097 family beta strand repeat-containing protein [Methanocella paludicola]BAI60978.1 conserved hypothetical protein [Methanocella paludicola SANAE]
MNTSKIITGGIVAIAILAVLLMSGCTSMNTIVEHRQDKTVHGAAENIDLTVTTFNGNIEIQESTEYDVEVTYNITAPEGHLQHVTTGTNGSRDGNTLKLTAEAKLSDPNEKLPINHGCDILVKVPKNSSYNLNLMTSNGNVKVTQLNGNKMIIATSNGNVDAAAGNYSAIDAATSNGNINVKLLSDTQFFVDASTSNGRITHNSIQMQADKESQTSLIGSTASGRGNLHMVLQTSNGNIDLSYI